MPDDPVNAVAAPPAPLRRSCGGESLAHSTLKRLALFWAQQQGYNVCALEVSLPRSPYRADLAAYKPGRGRVQERERYATGHTLGATAVFECKQSRADFLKDSRNAQKTRAELRDLHARRLELETSLRVHYPTLRVSDSLFQEYHSHDFATLRHDAYQRCLRRIAALQNRLFEGTKFDALLRWRCGNLLYVVAEEGIFEPAEIPVGWGLLVRVGESLELRAKPVWQELADHERLAILHKIAATGTRGLNRASGITFEQICEARRLGA